MFSFSMYTLKNNGVAIATAITVAQLKCGVNGPAVIMRHSLGQGSSVSQQQVASALVRKSAAATVTAAVAGTTLNKQNPISIASDASLGTSATGITATVEGTDGEIQSSRAYNNVNGQETILMPEERPVVAQGGIIAQKLLVANNVTWYSELAFIELRGS